MLGSINETLGTLPSGRVVPFSDDEVTKHLRECYLHSDAHEARQRAAQDRLDLYFDRGEAQIRAMADALFKDERVAKWRKAFIEIALFQNVTRRVVREISAVYADEATRTVRSGNKRYQELQRRLRLDRRMRRINQLANLLNDVVVWFRVKPKIGPHLEVIPPSKFWAVCHPNDPEHLVAVIVDQSPAVERPVTEPHYLAMTEDGWFRLDKRGRLAGGFMTWGTELAPWILHHAEEPVGALLNPDRGKDLIHAHKAVALLNVMMLKHQRSGTKQAVATGDLGDAPVGQPMDEEHILQMPEGVSMTTLDMGANPSNYIDAARAVIKQVAANYGIPESVFDLSYQATSGFEIELKRTGLREVRRDQILDYRPLERRLAEVMSQVLAASGQSEFTFSTAGWSVDFGEVETPRDPMQMLSYWEKARQMGLISTPKMLMEMHPELDSKEAAKAIIREHAEDEAERVKLLRQHNVSPSTPADGSGVDGAQAPFNGGEDETEEVGDAA